MKKKLLCFTLALAATAPVWAQPNVGVSIGFREPGVYGRINIGGEPPPPVVYAEPVIVSPSPLVAQRQPIYLYVPPAHQRNWRRYCNLYAACGQPVYFVEDRWVRERWHDHHRHDFDGRRGREFDDRHDHGRHGDRDR